MQVRTVRTLQEVLHNILHFNGGVGSDSQIAVRLALFRHWYYVPLFDLFGAEKYMINYLRGSGFTKISA